MANEEQSQSITTIDVSSFQEEEVEEDEAIVSLRTSPEMNKESSVKQQVETLLAAKDNSTKDTISSNSGAKRRLRYHQLLLSACFSIVLLCILNSLSYVNRYTLPPVVGRLKVAFDDLSDKQLGFIQTCFELVYVATSPLFGYLADRLSRRYVLTSVLLLANVFGFASSFVPEKHFLLLLATRALLGMGEAAFSNIGPVIIADMFVGKMRTLVFALFQFAIPIGSFLGYGITSLIVDYFDDWRWAFRLTPLPVLLNLALLFFCVREPRRGEAENAPVMASMVDDDTNTFLVSRTPFVKDLASILKTPSFTLTMFASIGVSFATGAFGYWVGYLVITMFSMHSAATEHSTEIQVGFMLGTMILLSGITGVVGGSLASSKWLKPKCGPAGDAIVCGVGMLFAGPFYFAALIFIQMNMMPFGWTMIFLGTSCLCTCWVLISEITMNVVIPNRRATAAAFMSAVSHLFGDALSPYLIGTVSDLLRASSFIVKTTDSSSMMMVMNSSASAPGDGDGGGGGITSLMPPVNLTADFVAMQTSLFLAPIVVILSGGCFLIASLYLNEDTLKTKRPIVTTKIKSSKTTNLSDDSNLNKTIQDMTIITTCS